MNFNLIIKGEKGGALVHVYVWETHSPLLTTESLDGYSPNFVGIKYSRPCSFVFTFGTNPPRGRSRAGP